MILRVGVRYIKRGQLEVRENGSMRRGWDTMNLAGVCFSAYREQ